MTDEELKDLAKLECKKLLESEKGYNGLSFQEFWAEGVKYGLAEGRKEICKLCETKIKEKGKSCAYRSCGNEYCWEK